MRTRVFRSKKFNELWNSFNDDYKGNKTPDTKRR